MTNPLDVWRSKASFKPSKLRQQLFGSELTEYQLNIWDTLLREPVFVDQGSSSNDLNSKRALTFQRLKVLNKHNLLSDDDMLTCPQKFLAFNEAIQMLDGSLLPMFALNTQVSCIIIICMLYVTL